MRQINILTVIVLVSVLGLAACDARAVTTSIVPTPVPVIPTATSLPTSTTATPLPTPTPTQTPTKTPVAIPAATPCLTSNLGVPVRQILFSGMECGAGECWGDSSIYLIHSDGTGLRQVFQGQGGIQELALSPGGTNLAFTESHGWGGYGVYTLDLATGSALRLRTDLLSAVRMPRWVSDDQVLCVAQTGVSSNVFLVDVDGRRWQQLTELPPNKGLHDLAVSPDGTQLLFAEYDSDAGRAAVYRMNIDGTGLQELISFPGDRPLEVGWSPSGNGVIVYHRSLSSTDLVLVYLASREGAEMMEIAQLTGYSHLLAWTPDESELIFYSCSSTPETQFDSVVAVRRDGSGIRTVTMVVGTEELGTKGLCPSPTSLSLDQAQLAFPLYAGGRRSLYVMDMPTGCWQHLISGYSVSSILWIP